MAAAQLWNPVAVAVDSAGDLLVADNGDQSVLLAPAARRDLLRHAGRRGRHRRRRGRDGRATSRISPTACPPRAWRPSSTTPAGSPSARPARCSSPTASCTSSGWCPPTTGVLFGRSMTAGDLYSVGRRAPGRRPPRGSGTARAGCSPRWGRRSASRCRRRARCPTATRSLDTVRVIGGGVSMSRFGRRTFLASSTGIAAGAAVAGALAVRRRAGRWRGRGTALAERGRRRRGPPGGTLRAVGAHGQRPRRPRRRRPRRLLVRLDPAGTRAAPWRRRRTASWCAGPTRPSAGSSGTAARCRRPARPSSPTGDRPSPPTRPTSGRCSRAVPAGRWGPVSAPARFTTALRAADWQAQWLRPAGDFATARPRHLPAHRGHAARRRPPPRHGLRLRRPHLPAVRGRGAGGRLAQLLVPRRAVRACRRPDRRAGRRADQRHRRAAPLVRARQGAAGVRAGPPVPAVPLVRRRPPRRGRCPTRAGASARPNGCPSPQRNPDGGDFVEWVDGRDHPQGWSSPGYDDGAWSPVTVIGPAGTAPFTRTYAQRTTIRESPVLPVSLHTVAGGAVVADFGAVYAARPRIAVRARGRPGTRSPCGRATCSIRTGRSRRCTGRRRRTSRSPTSWGRGATRPSRPSPTSGTATCRSTIRASL